MFSTPWKEREREGGRERERKKKKKKKKKEDSYATQTSHDKGQNRPKISLWPRECMDT